jgi:hypothetical protein
MGVSGRMSVVDWDKVRCLPNAFDIAADNAGHREDLWSSSHKG